MSYDHEAQAAKEISQEIVDEEYLDFLLGMDLEKEMSPICHENLLHNTFWIREEVLRKRGQGEYQAQWEIWKEKFPHGVSNALRLSHFARIAKNNDDMEKEHEKKRINAAFLKYGDRMFDDDWNNKWAAGAEAREKKMTTDLEALMIEPELNAIHLIWKQRMLYYENTMVPAGLRIPEDYTHKTTSEWCADFIHFMMAKNGKGESEKEFLSNKRGKEAQDAEYEYSNEEVFGIGDQEYNYKRLRKMTPEEKDAEKKAEKLSGQAARALD
jgi:hypothetical protein